MSESSNPGYSKPSFSKRIKEELNNIIPEARHCRIAEMAVMVAFLGKGAALPKKFFTLLNKTINISECVKGESISDWSDIDRLLKLSGSSGPGPVKEILLQHECCRKAFIRGAFLAAGRITDPNKSYHLEIASEYPDLINQLLSIFESFGIPAHTTLRNNYHVVYIKEGTALVDTLGIMGAPIGLMEFENVRILKDIRNDLNRRVNCEAANIKKTINAAMDQIEAINYIDQACGLKELPGGLYEIAGLRRKYPEASLVELGAMLTPPIGKSGVNHRLRRICQFAEGLRREGYEKRSHS